MKGVTQYGGALDSSVVKDTVRMLIYSYFIVLILLIVYMPSVSNETIRQYDSYLYRGIGLFLVAFSALCLGWTYGILSALAYALFLSRLSIQISPFTDRRAIESFQNYIVPLATQPHRWLSEQILGENPFMIRQVPVNTSAVQDYSEKNYVSSRSSR